MADATQVAEPTGPDDPDVADKELAKIVDVDERIKIRRTEVLQVRAVADFLGTFAPALIEPNDGMGEHDQGDVDTEIVSARNLAILHGFQSLSAIFRRWARFDAIGGSL